MDWSTVLAELYHAAEIVAAVAAGVSFAGRLAYRALLSDLKEHFAARETTIELDSRVRSVERQVAALTKD